MASKGTASTRQQGLQQAASVLFALMAIVPLLLFAFTLWQLDVLHRTLAQVSLGLTLALMLLAFWLFRSMLAQMSEVVKGLTRVMQTVARPSGSSGDAAVAPSPAPAREVPGLGSIWELGEMAHTMDLLWQREARAHVGRRVQVSVMHSQELAGTLLEATEEGLLLEQPDGDTVAITYRRVQGIEPLIAG